MGVGDDHDLLVQDRVGAERVVAGRLGHVEPHTRLEPLPLRVDEAHERDRHLADVRGQERHVVEDLLGRGVENLERLQRGQATLLVVRIHRSHAPTVLLDPAGRGYGRDVPTRRTITVVGCHAGGRQSEFARPSPGSPRAPAVAAAGIEVCQAPGLVDCALV